ncbi:hypothetical protein PR048_012765 [Dryococelus australis]|uniref:Retrovirus-related Pol polyprotein from transposon TNT 1-94-like beta-barrel domain-containing protein n=1 Tax=Dryococelus australis TaxID=614101 RepID=A0ABQ9HR25_9NEOP|nr:hypothetical protein PR048_012765 [Dryococelus australis]
MASAVADEYKIPKLNGENCFVWSIGAKAKLVSKKLWGAVITTPQGTNYSALAFLILIVGDKSIEDLGTCTLVEEALTVLKVMHTRFSLYHTRMLLLEYSGGIEFTDKQKAAFYLRGLLFPKYDGFARNIKREGDSNVISTTAIKTNLLLEEKIMKRKGEVKDKVGESKALVIHENASKYKHEAKHTFNKPNYKQRNVRLSDSVNQPKNIVCFACNETGHISRYSPRYMKGEQGSPTNRLGHSSEPRKGSATSNGSWLLQWFVASAASHHMTSHKELFKNFERATGSIFRADDSPLKVEGCQQLDKKGLILVIQNVSIRALNKLGQAVFAAFADEGGNEMYVNEAVNPSTSIQKASGTVKKSETIQCHRRFGYMQKLPYEVAKTETNENYDVCIRGKMKRWPFPAR